VDTLTTIKPEKISLSNRERIIHELYPQKFGRRGKIWTATLIVLCLIGAFAYYRQLRYGLVVTGMRDYVSWGIYISNFVFFVAISLVGSLITAVLRLADVHWSTPLTRIAEIIAVSAIFFASAIIIVDMGRPERFVHLFMYGRLQSPIMWDVIVIGTYFIISILLVYLPLLPDLKILIAHKEKNTRWLNKYYRFLGSFWRGTDQQFKIANRGITILCITIIPVAFCIHTVTSWLFATTYRPGWDSTNFGAYFISGAFLVGAGAVVVAMYVFRKAYNLEKYITAEHFNKMGKIVVLLALLYLYFNINEFLVPAFKMKKPEEEHLTELFAGKFAPLFWFAILTSMIVPIIIMLFKAGRKPKPMFIAGVLIVVGAWCKRFLIVTPTLLHPFLPMSNVPDNYRHYFPTWEEWAIAIGSLAGALLVITFFVRILPIIPIHETITEEQETIDVQPIATNGTATNNIKEKIIAE
jgi:Ni/Fe-hydrogenase subunit HybB-like protein